VVSELHAVVLFALIVAYFTCF